MLSPPPLHKGTSHLFSLYHQGDGLGKVYDLRFGQTIAVIRRQDRRDKERGSVYNLSIHRTYVLAGTEEKEMSEPARAWKFTRSLQWALLIGALAGLAVTGLTYTKFVWDLQARESVLLGAGVAVGLTLFLTYLFDRVSMGVGSFRRAVKGRQNSTKD